MLSNISKKSKSRKYFIVCFYK